MHAHNHVTFIKQNTRTKKMGPSENGATTFSEVKRKWSLVTDGRFIMHADCLSDRAGNSTGIMNKKQCRFTFCTVVQSCLKYTSNSVQKCVGAKVFTFDLYTVQEFVCLINQS